MAGIDVGGSSSKRATNSEINMIPFIDLLMVTIAFLLITAVWATNSRIDASASVPGPSGCGEDCPQQVEKVLDVHVRDDEFGLVWRQAGTVISELKLPKSAVLVGEGADRTVRYPDLAQRIESEWAREGGHRDVADRRVDQAVLHTSDRTAYREIVAVLDALYAPKRDMRFPDGSVHRVPAFNMVFSSR